MCHCGGFICQHSTVGHVVIVQTAQLKDKEDFVCISFLTAKLELLTRLPMKKVVVGVVGVG